MRIVHLSDLHFGAHDAAIADALIADIAGLGVDLVVVSGDFTQIGSIAEFEQAEAFLTALPAPFFAVPGNHDLPVYNLFERFTAPYRRYRHHIADELEPFVSRDGVALVGLKTSRRALLGFDWSDGSISPGQLRRLTHRFSGVPESDFKIVVAHHPLLHPTEGGIVQDIVARADRALAAFAEAGVRLVLSGHFHVSYVRYHETVQAAGADAPPIVVLQTGSAISTRLRGHPNAYNLVDIDGDAVTLGRRIWHDGAWIEGEQFVAPA